MKRYIVYMALMAALMLTGCEEPNEQNAPNRGQEIVLSFSVDSNADINYIPSANAPRRAASVDPLPGDPGKDDFLPPTNLYFIMWVQLLGTGEMQMAAVKETGLKASDWEDNGKGIYTLKNKSYRLIIPKDNEQIVQLEGSVFHVFAFASTEDLLTDNQLGGITFTAFTDEEKTVTNGQQKGRKVVETTVTLATLEALTYAIPSTVTTQEGKRAFFRSMYSTAFSENAHNQMATSPTIRLRHTAARLDINWECDIPDSQTSPLTANSTWTIATAYFPTAFSLFKPGANTGATSWSEQITIDEGMRYNGRYVTYLPMPTTPTFTVTSSVDVLNPDGDDAEAKKTKTLELSAGSDVNYATWMRALWTIKQQ